MYGPQGQLSKRSDLRMGHVNDYNIDGMSFEGDSNFRGSQSSDGSNYNPLNSARGAKPEGEDHVDNRNYSIQRESANSNNKGAKLVKKVSFAPLTDRSNASSDVRESMDIHKVGE